MYVHTRKQKEKKKNQREGLIRIYIEEGRERRVREKEKNGKRESRAEEDREHDQQASDVCKEKGWCFEESIRAFRSM